MSRKQEYLDSPESRVVSPPVPPVGLVAAVLICAALCALGALVV